MENVINWQLMERYNINLPGVLEGIGRIVGGLLTNRSFQN